MGPRGKLGTAVVALAALAVVVGQHRVAQTAPLKTVRMGIGVDMSYASYVVLAQKRFGEKYGLKAEYRQFDTGVGGVEAVVSNQMDMGSVSELPGLIAYAKRGNLRNVMLPLQSGVIGGIGAVKGIQKLEDLSGKRIGIQFGGVGEFFWSYFTKEHPDLVKTMKVLNVPVADQLVAMAKGDLDAIVSWYPWLSRMPDVVSGGHLLGHWKDYGYEMKHAMWLNQKFIQDDRKAAVDFIRAYVDTVKWMNASRANWEESAALSAKAFNIPANLALSQLDRITFLAAIDDVFVQRQIDAALWAAEKGILKGPNPEKIAIEAIEAGLLRDAAPDLVKLSKFKL
jgi:ABC-type nitrate/sulfonate/bicarbonate transport system substrate-binding protein